MARTFWPQGFDSVDIDRFPSSSPVVHISPESSAVVETCWRRAGYDEYEGNHTNRVFERIETNALPFFSKQLLFEAGRAGDRVIK